MAVMTNESPHSHGDFGGLAVAAFESRRAAEMASLIRRHGGEPHVAPSMREVPLEEDSTVVEFARRLLAGRIEVVLFLTGVGTRALVEAAARHVSRAELLEALGQVVVVARGPKPVAVLRELGVPITHRVPEPNTWRETLELLDAEVPLEGRSVAVQEYGVPNRNLITGLEARGAAVFPVAVYRWDLPEDAGPLEATVRAIAADEIDVLLFTSSMQVLNVVKVAAELGLSEAFRKAVSRMVIGSIGPTSSETLWGQGLAVDFEPEHPKMGHLVSAAASKAGPLREKKRRLFRWTSLAEPRAVDDAAPALTSKLRDSRMMRALARQPTDTTPVWIMRQAGRYMPEYRAVRDKVSFLELCKRPDLAAEVTVTAVDRLGVDAAIIFSDILPLLEPMGMSLEYAQGEGPVIHNPVRTYRDIDRLSELESVEALDFVFQAIRQSRAALPADVPLLGFAGAPFTLASYAIEGGSSRSFQHTKVLMYRDPGAWHALLGRITGSLINYLNGQIAAGVQAVQLFDSWAGCLAPDDYRQFVLPHTKRVVEGLIPGVPLIQFTTGNPALLPLLREAGGDCIGLDWRVDLGEAWAGLGYDVAVQGNLDPLVLFAEPEEIRRRAKAILDRAAGRPGHIFNLGHGILPQTPVEHAVALVDAVHELGRR
jgi:uroporphyrinogen decarboxylase